MEGIAKALATMLLGTTVQLDQSAYFDTSCYAVVYAPEPHVVLEGTCRAKPFDSAWETADSFILPLGPRDYDPESGEGGHFFLIQKRVLGKRSGRLNGMIIHTNTKRPRRWVTTLIW